MVHAMRWALVIVLVGCGAAPKSTQAPARPVIAKVLPTYAEIANAPDCVRKVAEQRLSSAELGLSGRSNGSLPNLGNAWQKMQDTEGSFVPADLRRDWNQPVPVTVLLAAPSDAATDASLDAVGLVRGSVIGPVVSGSIPLHQLVCLAELTSVKRIELNDPTRAHVDASPSVSQP
jgi:hypothetical protein